MRLSQDKLTEFNEKYGPDIRVRTLSETELIEKFTESVKSEVYPEVKEIIQKELDKIQHPNPSIFIDFLEGIENPRFVLPLNFNNQITIRRQTGEIHTFVFQESKLVKEIYRPVKE